jgi:hypothetical protein
MNPGFEADAVLDQPPVPAPTGWTSFGNSNTASATLEPVHTGMGSLQLAGGGGFGVPGSFQTFPAKPGQVWDLQGYMFTKDALPTGATFGLLKIVFGSGSGDLEPAAITIGQAGPTANPGIEALPFLNSDSAPNTWHFAHAQGVAPEGTVEVRLFALFVDENPGTGYFDDLQGFIAGDFDMDLGIDADDLTVWKNAYGLNSAGDADGDNDTDGNDLLMWQRALGNPAAVTTAAVSGVPEPASALLLAAGLACVGCIRRTVQRLAS